MAPCLWHQVIQSLFSDPASSGIEIARGGIQRASVAIVCEGDEVKIRQNRDMKLYNMHVAICQDFPIYLF